MEPMIVRLPAEVWKTRTNAVNYQLAQLTDLIQQNATKAVMDRHIMLVEAWLDYIKMLQAGLIASE